MIYSILVTILSYYATFPENHPLFKNQGTKGAFPPGHQGSALAAAWLVFWQPWRKWPRGRICVLHFLLWKLQLWLQRDFRSSLWVVEVATWDSNQIHATIAQLYIYIYIYPYEIKHGWLVNPLWRSIAGKIIQKWRIFQQTIFEGWNPHCQEFSVLRKINLACLGMGYQYDRTPKNQGPFSGKAGNRMERSSNYHPASTFQHPVFWVAIRKPFGVTLDFHLGRQQGAGHRRWLLQFPGSQCGQSEKLCIKERWFPEGRNKDGLMNPLRWLI